MLKVVILFNVIPMMFLTFFNIRIFRAVEERKKFVSNLNQRKASMMYDGALMRLGQFLFILIQNILETRHDSLQCFDHGRGNMYSVPPSQNMSEHNRTCHKFLGMLYKILKINLLPKKQNLQVLK